MSLLSELAAVAKTIARGATVAVGTRRAATAIEKALPKVSGRAKEAWARIKSTKSTGKARVDWIAEDEEEPEDPNFKSAKTKSAPTKLFTPEAEAPESPQEDTPTEAEPEKEGT